MTKRLQAPRTRLLDPRQTYIMNPRACLPCQEGWLVAKNEGSRRGNRMKQPRQSDVMKSAASHVRRHRYFPILRLLPCPHPLYLLPHPHCRCPRQPRPSPQPQRPAAPHLPQPRRPMTPPPFQRPVASSMPPPWRPLSPPPPPPAPLLHLLRPVAPSLLQPRRSTSAPPRTLHRRTSTRPQHRNHRVAPHLNPPTWLMMTLPRPPPPPRCLMWTQTPAPTWKQTRCLGRYRCLTLLCQ